MQAVLRQRRLAAVPQFFRGRGDAFAVVGMNQFGAIVHEIARFPAQQILHRGRHVAPRTVARDAHHQVAGVVGQQAVTTLAFGHPAAQSPTIGQCQRHRQRSDAEHAKEDLRQHGLSCGRGRYDQLERTGPQCGRDARHQRNDGDAQHQPWKAVMEHDIQQGREHHEQQRIARLEEHRDGDERQPDDVAQQQQALPWQAQHAAALQQRHQGQRGRDDQAQQMPAEPPVRRGPERLSIGGAQHRGGQQRRGHAGHQARAQGDAAEQEEARVLGDAREDMAHHRRHDKDLHAIGQAERQRQGKAAAEYAAVADGLAGHETHERGDQVHRPFLPRHAEQCAEHDAVGNPQGQYAAGVPSEQQRIADGDQHRSKKTGRLGEEGQLGVAARLCFGHDHDGRKRASE